MRFLGLLKSVCVAVSVLILCVAQDGSASRRKKRQHEPREEAVASGSGIHAAPAAGLAPVGQILSFEPRVCIQNLDGMDDLDWLRKRQVFAELEDAQAEFSGIREERHIRGEREGPPPPGNVAFGRLVCRWGNGSKDYYTYPLMASNGWHMGFVSGRVNLTGYEHFQSIRDPLGFTVNEYRAHVRTWIHNLKTYWDAAWASPEIQGFREGDIAKHEGNIEREKEYADQIEVLKSILSISESEKALAELFKVLHDEEEIEEMHAQGEFEQECAKLERDIASAGGIANYLAPTIRSLEERVQDLQQKIRAFEKGTQGEIYRLVLNYPQAAENHKATLEEAASTELAHTFYHSEVALGLELQTNRFWEYNNLFMQGLLSCTIPAGAELSLKLDIVTYRSMCHTCGWRHFSLGLLNFPWESQENKFRWESLPQKLERALRKRPFTVNPRLLIRVGSVSQHTDWEQVPQEHGPLADYYPRVLHLAPRGPKRNKTPKDRRSGQGWNAELQDDTVEGVAASSAAASSGRGGQRGGGASTSRAQAYEPADPGWTRATNRKSKPKGI